MTLTRPKRQCRVAVTDTASTAKLASETQIRVEALECNMLVKVGEANTVAASRTADGDGFFADDTFHVTAGAVEVFDLYPTDKYFSVIAENEGETGTAYVSFGNGEG